MKRGRWMSRLTMLIVPLDLDPPDREDREGDVAEEEDEVVEGLSPRGLVCPPH